MGTVLADEQAGVRLRGFAVAFDRLAKAHIFVFNAKSSNCISEVSCSLLSSPLLLLKSVTTTLIQAMRNSDPRVRMVLVHGHNSDLNFRFTLQVTGCDFQHGSKFGVPSDPAFRFR